MKVGQYSYLSKILLRVLVTARLANVRTPEVSILHCSPHTWRSVTPEKGECCVDTVVSRCLQDKLIQALASLRGIEMYVRQIIDDCKVWQTALQTSIGGRLFYRKMALLEDAFQAHEKRRRWKTKWPVVQRMRAKDADWKRIELRQWVVHLQ